MDKSPHIHPCIEAKNKKASVFDRGFFIFIGAREMNPKPSNHAACSLFLGIFWGSYRAQTKKSPPQKAKAPPK